MIYKKGAPTAHLFCICIFRVTQAKLKIELFKLFAKVLLAFRPFAMCLKMMKFCKKMIDVICCIFCVSCLSVVSTNGMLACLVGEFKVTLFG